MFQCFETPDMGPGIFTINVSKQLKVWTRNFLPVSCFNVSKHQIWGLEFSPFYVSVCFETFRNN